MIKDSFKNFLIYSKYLLPYWKKEILILLLSLTAALISLVNPYIAKLFIDKAYAQADLKLFIMLVVAGGLIYIINSLLNGLSNYLKEYISVKVGFAFNKQVFTKIQNLPYSVFQKRPSGEYMYRLSSDVNQISSFVTDGLPQATFLLFKFLFTFIVAVYLNWKMAFFALALSPLLYIRSNLFIRPIRRKTEELFQNSENAFEIVREVFSNMELVKTFGKELAEVRRYIHKFINSLRVKIATTKLSIINSFAESWFNKLLLGSITFYGGYQIIKGTMTLGSFTAIMLYINQLIGLESSLVGLYERFVMSSISWQRLDGILSAEEDKDENGAKEFIFLSGAVQFKDVSFSYKKDKFVVRNLNFNIEGGYFVGLVGPSGRGKTTIINLLVRLYKPDDGSIFIDARDIRLIEKKSLTEQIGVAMQKPFLWNDTIINNIKYARPKASDEEVFQAAKTCHSDDFIRDFPDGYNTVLGEAGARISEGQKQRIALARAVIKKPKLLIIDEGMASLDSQTEDKIIDNLKRELQGSTVIVISHRLSTIRKMDRVYFLESSSEIISGVHKDLVNRHQEYRDLFASQIEEEDNSKIKT